MSAYKRPYPIADPTTHNIGSNDRWNALADPAWLTLIGPRLAANHTHTAATIDDCLRLARELAALIDGYGTADAVEHFLTEPAAWPDRHDRWATLLTVEHLLRLPKQLDRWPGWKPPPGRARPLRPLELGLTRLVALNRPILAALVGLADAGADSGELAVIYDFHIVRTEDGEPHTITFPGEPATVTDSDGTKKNRRGPSPARPRPAALPLWCRPAIKAVLDFENRESAEPLLYLAAPKDPTKKHKSPHNRLMALRWETGLGHDTATKPLSIRNGSARELYDSGAGIEAVGSFLGITDLTTCQRHIGVRLPRPLRSQEKGGRAGTASHDPDSRP